MADKNTRHQAPNNTTVVDIAGGKKGVSRKKAVKDRESKKKSKLPLFIFILVLVLLLAAFITAHFFFDLFGWKEPMFDMMHHLDPNYSEIADRESALDDRESKLEQRELSLTERESAIVVKELQVSTRETELAQLEKSRTPVYRPPINDSDREYMEGIAKIYAGMEPEKAASVMVNLYSVEDMAAIIYFMSTSKAAGILECVTPALAAQITDQLINVHS